MGFGERLRTLREAAGLSQAKLGRTLSLDKSTISLYEAEKREPSQAVLQKIADYFRVSVDYLIRGEGYANLDDPLFKLPPKIRNFIVQDIENGARYLNVLVEAAERGVSPCGLEQILDALIAATETVGRASHPNK